MPQFTAYPQGGALQADDILVADRPGVGTVQVEGTAFTAFPPYPSAPANPTPGVAYFDTSLGYPRIYGSDGKWHGIMLS